MKIFVVNHFYPDDVLGGSEIQCRLIAKYLAKMGHRISYLALEGLGGIESEEKDGVRIFYLSQKGENKGTAFKNFYRLIKKERPDLIYIRIFRYFYFLNRSAKKAKIPVVFNTSHINDCKPFLGDNIFSFNPFLFARNMRLVAQRYLNFRALREAHIITINKEQSNLLKSKYGIKNKTIYNSMEDGYGGNIADKEKIVVWVNNIKGRKRPELFIQLADQLRGTGYKFLMVGNIHGNKHDYEQMFREAEERNNDFRFLGGKTPEEVNDILTKAQIMVNTCEPEGFGNNFIQAWFSECPTVTLSFDPDNIMKNNKIGINAGTFEKMVKCVKMLMESDNVRNDMAKRARIYALKNHNPSANIALYENYFKEIIQSND